MMKWCPSPLKPHEAPGHYKYCALHGHLLEELAKCESCSERVYPDDQFCHNCGNKLYLLQRVRAV